ncbi:MAG: IMP cyclohydrolase [Oscillospiraceae bacterium]|nr:IMP cyclohydrolase [Oscillospiraceae bacterium]
MKKDIINLLKENPYPGRGLMIGCSEDGLSSIILYFIMGRSENSRNRIFVKTDDGIRTMAFDESKMTDPTLIIYHPVRAHDGVIIVTNGDQTDTILDFQMKKESYYKALQTRQFEPDAPNFTPRISGILRSGNSYAISVLKTIDGSQLSQRCFYEYENLTPSLGHFVSTYQSDGDPLPSFVGEPIAIDINCTNDFEAYANSIWNALNEDNKVSLYAAKRNIKTGETKEIVINKHK